MVLPQIDKCSLTGYTVAVRIRNFLHKGLKRLCLEDDPAGPPPFSIDKLRKMIAFLEAMHDAGELSYAMCRCGKRTF